jgi:endonuclease/exonuclease/phosphatase family metal-dependent hydrolase
MSFFASMKYLILLLTSFSMLHLAGAETTSFRVATYNIRYDARADDESGNPWQVRKHEVAKLIQRHQFDVVGVQEPNAKQLAEFQALMPDYAHSGHSYGGKNGDAHHAATFYKKDFFTALDTGVFWFSETPEVPSIGWDATDRRICSWIKLQVKATRQVFYVFNAHFYWKNQSARENSGKVLVNQVNAIAGDAPVIALGDFNSKPGTPQIADVKKRLRDAFEVTQTPRQGEEHTGFPGGVFQGKPDSRIDYLFVSPHFGVKDYRVISDVYNGDHYPSDHLPVTSLVELNSDFKN